jgi:prepilin-type N-terminal cleavage/methylation domain-containing protein
MIREYFALDKVFAVSNRKAKKFVRLSLKLRDFALFPTELRGGPLNNPSPAMKSKGFTLLELVVACTILLLLSTLATTTTYNFVQAAANLKAQYNNVFNIMALSKALTSAKMNYATDLAMLLAQASNTNNPNPTLQTQITQEIAQWNTLAQQNDNPSLIGQLINPPQLQGLPFAPINSPPTRSYLPASRNAPVTTYMNGNPVTTYVLVQIIDIDSLLRAYQLTDDGTPTGNVIATIQVGPMLDVTRQIRPTLPTIDWKAGTVQEIQY